MIKCSNCGAEIEDGSKFCGECGAAIPQGKECPQCHAKLAIGAKFCMECGYSFAGKGAGGVTIGDKNVIAGDVVGKKESYHVSGNATIVKNDDESKKMVRCSICGKNMAVADSITCRGCGEIVCEGCFVGQANKCKKCVGAECVDGEEEYRDAVTEALKDGTIDAEDRRKLSALQKKLSLSAVRAVQIEKDLKASSIGCAKSQDLGQIDKINRDRAFVMLYEDGDYKSAAELLSPIVERKPDDEDILSLYIGALAKYNPVKARRVVEALKADVLAGALAMIDIELLHEDLSAAENRIRSAELIWPDSPLLKCRKILFLIAMAKMAGDVSFLAEAKDLLDASQNDSDPVVKSWIYYSSNLIKAAGGEPCEQKTKDECKQQNLLWDIVSQAEDRSGALYCIIDLSRGIKAEKFPVMYMNTSSEAGWSIEHKTDLLVLRKVLPGKYLIGHGDPDLPTIQNLLNQDFEIKNFNPRHMVTISKSYYIGVFPFTQRQWELVCGPRKFMFSNPEFSAARPVDDLSYFDIRGKGVGSRWPRSVDVDSNSVISILRKKTHLNGIDLPTDAQWEIACRAGSESDFYNGTELGSDVGENSDKIRGIGRIYCNQDVAAHLEEAKNLPDGDESYSDPLLDLIERIGKSKVNADLGTAEVGSYSPNKWGIYDCIGNVSEWCLNPDFGDSPDAVGMHHCDAADAIDPVGWLPVDSKTKPAFRSELTVDSRSHRVLRGGNWEEENPEKLTVWYRSSSAPSYSEGGFRISFSIEDEIVESLLAECEKTPSVVEKEAAAVRAAALKGNLYAEYCLAGLKKMDERVKDLTRLHELNIPIAGRSLAKIELDENTDQGCEHAVKIYRKNISLGDVPSSVCLRRMRDFPESVENAVLSILKTHSSAFSSTDALNLGSELERRMPVFTSIMKRHFRWNDAELPKKIFAVVAEQFDYDYLEDQDVFWESHFIAFTSDGLVVIQGGDRGQAYFSGVITWYELCKFGDIKAYDGKGEDAKNQVISFCPNIPVASYIFSGHSDAAVDAYRKIVEYVKGNPRLFSADEHAKNNGTTDEVITNEKFKALLQGASDYDGETNLIIARCYRNGVGTEVNLIEAIKRYGLACRVGVPDAIKEFNDLVSADKYVIPMLRFAIEAAVKEMPISGSFASLSLDGDELNASRKRFTAHYFKSALRHKGAIPELLAAIETREGGGIFFATDGVYVLNQENYERGDGYIPWPSFDENNVDSRDDRTILFGGGAGVAFRDVWHDTRKMILEILNAIALQTKKLYSNEVMNLVQWLRTADGQSQFSPEEIGMLEKLKSNGCTQAAQALQRCSLPASGIALGSEGERDVRKNHNTKKDTGAIKDNAKSEGNTTNRRSDASEVGRFRQNTSEASRKKEDQNKADNAAAEKCAKEEKAKAEADEAKRKAKEEADKKRAEEERKERSAERWGKFQSFVLSLLPSAIAGYGIYKLYMAGDLFHAIALGAPLVIAMIMYWCRAVHYTSLYLLYTVLVGVASGYGYQYHNWDYAAIVGCVGLGALIQNCIWHRHVFHSVALYLTALAAGGLYLYGRWGVGTAVVIGICFLIGLLKEMKNSWTWWRWALYVLATAGGIVACFCNHEFWGIAVIICAGGAVADK